MFHNPKALDFMVASTCVLEHGSFFPKEEIRQEDYYDKLRIAQTREWSQDIVVTGIDMAKKGDLKNAVRQYNDALKIDPYNADAYTAKGAAYVA
mmetsp:Transcript_30551/g.34105  ORF Transcript_30551/g.34105 Transcript_30551/m.34105 type:complete len:94 (+) Transcript_30551:110-391(+)